MLASARHASAARPVSAGANRTGLALVLLAGCVLSGAAQAALMTVTITGTISSGSDAYRNSVYFGPTVTNNLAGMTASISLTYDTALMPNPTGANYSLWHQPAYPYFYGTAGQNPVRSGSFTVNGVTLALDVSGPGEVGVMQVQNANPAPDSYNLRGGDNRTTWCPNDSQCVESASIQAYSFVNLFDANGFGPEDVYTWAATASTSLTGSVRMFENIICQPAGQGGTGNSAGLCPAGRFDYTASPGATHFVAFELNGTQLSIATASPVPLPAAAWLMLGGISSLAGMQRRRAVVAA
jgi:hypothetical protein